jgi:GTPase SAR1 family protein
MGRIVQFCMGPAGSGKSTFCDALARHIRSLNRGGCVLVNLDPAAENICYRPEVDVRQLISLNESLELRLGPNGGLVFCMEYLASNLHWLRDALNDAGPGDNEHFIIDCPGQIELYTHVPALRKVVRALASWGFVSCGTFLIDAAMVVGDVAKYLSAILLATSAMTQLEMPWINLLSKADLISEEDAEVFCDVNPEWIRQRLAEAEALPSNGTRLASRLHRLNNAVCSLVENYSLVRFIPVDAQNADLLDAILSQVDMMTQYSEDLEPREPRDEDEVEED